MRAIIANLKINAAGLAAAVLALGLAAGCGAGTGGQEKRTAPPPFVEAQPAALKTMTQTVETTGEVAATNTVVVRALAEGEAIFCPWREGDSVEKGAKLVELDRRLLREELAATEAALVVAQARLNDLKAGARPEEIAQARETVNQIEAALNFATIDRERIMSLVATEALPGEAIDKARVETTKLSAQLASAKERLAMLEAGPTKTAVAVQDALVLESKARRETARARNEETLIAAPISGTITKVFIRPGDMVVPRSPLLEIMEKDSLVVRFEVPEAMAGAVRREMKCAVRFDAYPGKSFKGSVVRVYPDLDQARRTVSLEALVEGAPALSPGMFSRVSLVIREIKDAVVVPDSALRTMASGATVVFVLEGEKALMRKVKTGIEKGREIQILEGVKPGEIVVVAGNERLKDGIEVKVVKKGPQGQGGKPGEGDKK